ncbi:bifunctional DNA primase/polymerase-like protein [Krasilnikovia cinnamomea]|uniref:Bifunctional DNA primase/polymerase-like protein n=1 Tax=Krasilnikovia cinnamomea TaxID=349313 RepID=A0A4Q7ZFJ3_9ACTN|nr:bifunctional DNA primase/polymerase [Krasilnikovia cinnamomea]RZU48865.1 bifunctional DNA primase/polymerase-like protein [Krasilnikovia cinnamomea]
MSRIRAAFHDPDGARHGGLPTYWWQGAPTGYATRRQLRNQGLRPGGQPIAAQILWSGVGGTRTDLARPKRTATPAQLAAVGKALLARRTCPACHQERPYYIRRSLGQCETCHDTPAPSTPHTREPTTMPANDLLTRALGLADRGWHVFPLRPDDKRPAVRDWETRATTDPDRIRRCWTAGPYGIGIACGPSGLVVIDLDTPKPDQTPPPEWTAPGIHSGADVLAVLCERAGQPYPGDTYTVTTGRGGTHFYFTHPTDGLDLRNTAGTLGWLIDTRAHGGYVVAAGSTASGRPYRLLHNARPRPLPDWLTSLLRPKPLPPQQPVRVAVPDGRRGAYLHAAVQASLDAIAEAKDGTLNKALYGAAVALGQLVAGGALDETTTADLLAQAAIRKGHPERGARNTIRSGFRTGANRPRSVAA